MPPVRTPITPAPRGPISVSSYVPPRFPSQGLPPETADGQVIYVLLGGNKSRGLDPCSRCRRTGGSGCYSLEQVLHKQPQVRTPHTRSLDWCRIGDGRRGRHTFDRPPLPGDGLCGRHILAFNDPFHNLRKGYIDGLLRDALGIALLRDDDLLHREVNDLFDSALLNALLDLSLVVNAMGLVGAVVRRRHGGASDSDLLVLSEGAQTALSPTAGALRSVKGSLPLVVRLNELRRKATPEPKSLSQSGYG